jgi:hypothetical protein
VKWRQAREAREARDARRERQFADFVALRATAMRILATGARPVDQYLAIQAIDIADEALAEISAQRSRGHLSLVAPDPPNES